MSDFRNKLATRREQQLADLRERTGTFEQFTLDFACAGQDKTFRGVFVKRPQASKFVCEKIERTQSSSLMGRVRGFFSPGASKQLNVQDADFSQPCDCCGSRGWALCSKCGAFVCYALSVGQRFQCRRSCGETFIMGPMISFSASPSGGNPDHTPLIGHQAAKRLTKG